MTRNLRITSLALLTAGTIALAACGSQNDAADGAAGGGGEGASGASISALNDVTPRAGRWETVMKVTKMEIPGMPPEVQNMMKEQMGAVQTSFSCLTPEQAAKPKEDFFTPGTAEGCNYDNFTMGGGKIAVDMTCEHNGSKQVMKMDGTYSEEDYTMNVTSDGEMQPGKPMSMAMQLSARRVGECDGKEK